MPPNPRLDEAMGVGRRGFRPQARAARDDGAFTQDRGQVVRTYKWSQFWGKEEVTEFDEAHFKCEGKFQQNSSQGHKEYQDRLRCIHLRKEGMQKAEIAKSLGRSEKFVAKWWQKDKQEVPRPWGVHEYLTKDMGRKESGVGATNAAQMLDDSASDTATWWRDVEVRRNYAQDPTIYDDILKNTDWKATNARTRDFATGAYHLKYDQRGNIKWEGHQAGKYKQGLSAGMDKCLQKLFAEYGIADRTSGTLTNWYPDGQGFLGSHRHDCWTALFSFGHERILTIDNTPLLMQDGDLVIFGTQRHGVPVMPEITDGRITFVIFFYPDKMQKQGMWQTITDPDTMAPSRPLLRMIGDGDLGASAEKQVVEASKELQALQELGFSRADAEAALRASRFDVEQAAAMLLMAGACGGQGELAAGPGAFESCCGHLDSRGDPEFGADLAKEILLISGPQERGGRFRKRAAAGQPGSQADESTTSGANSSCSAPSSSSGSTTVSSSCLPECSRSGSSMDDSDEVMALALQLDELEAEQTADPALLAAQFGEYDSKLTQQDAERWNGHGDLMHSPFSREHLQLDKMEPVTLYSVGHGDMLEKDFWEMLQCHSIRVLYDVRQTDYRGELYSRHQRFSVASLRAQCRARGIFFKSMPLGRESAYGTLEHLQSDEGKHTLIELAWQGKRKRTAFMGKEEFWRDDARQVAAEELVKGGHRVEHVRSDGSTECHATGVEYPDWLVREADRLRLLEKKRQAGELSKPQKSRADRSSEAIAARLARPAEEVDAMREMQLAANQKELVVTQRRLARFQRLAEEKGALAAKVLTTVPQWIKDDARKQAEWVAAKKLEKVAEEAAGVSGSTGGKKQEEVEQVDVQQLQHVALSELEQLETEALLAQFPQLFGDVDCEGAFGAIGLLANSGDAPAPTFCEEHEDAPADAAQLSSQCSDQGSEATSKRSSWRGRRRKDMET